MKKGIRHEEVEGNQVLIKHKRMRKKKNRGHRAPVKICNSKYRFFIAREAKEAAQRQNKRTKHNKEDHYTLLQEKIKMRGQKSSIAPGLL